MFRSANAQGLRINSLAARLSPHFLVLEQTVEASYSRECTATLSGSAVLRSLITVLR